MRCTGSLRDFHPVWSSSSVLMDVDSWLSTKSVQYGRVFAVKKIEKKLKKKLATVPAFRLDETLADK
jgi:hypothetical protein